MPLGELRAVRTRTSDSVSSNGLGRKIRTEAILGAFFNSEYLNEFPSKGLCKKRSELGYSLRIFSTMDGPVNSNLLAPPTKHTAILDRSNSFFFLLRKVNLSSSTVRVELGGYDELKSIVVVFGFREKIDLKGAKADRGLMAAEERERNTSRERGKIRSRRRQLRSGNHLVKEMCFRGFLNISASSPATINYWFAFSPWTELIGA